MNRGPSSKKLKQGPTLHLVGESSADEFLRIRIVGIGAFGERMSHELQSRNLAEQLPNATVYFDTIALGVLTQYEEVMGSKTDEHIRIGIVELGRTTLDSFGWMFESPRSSIPPLSVGFFVVPFSGPKRDSAHRELQLLETLFDVSIVLDPMDFECWRDSAEKGDSEQLENSYFEEISQTILLWGRSVGNSSIVSFDFEDMHDIFRRAGKMNRSRGMAFDDATSSETAERAMTAALAFANITESRALLAVISSLPELGQLDNFRAARKRLYDNCSPCSTVLMSHVVDFTVPKGVVQADVWYFAGSN